MATIQERIRARRLEKGYTLLEVAEKLGVKEATMQRYESGEIKNIKHDTIVKLAEILNCAPQYLMGWIDTPFEISSSLSPIKKNLLTSFDKLNEAGQDKAVEYVNDLADNPKYQKENIKITPLPKNDNSDRVELKFEGDAPYIPKVAAAHHPTGDLSEADKKDIEFLNEWVGKMKKEQGNS